MLAFMQKASARRFWSLPQPQAQQRSTLRPDEYSHIDGVFGASKGHRLARIDIVPTAPVIQPKLQLDTPGDVYEREAERVADQVIGMTEPQVAPPVVIAGQVASRAVQRVAANQNPFLENAVIGAEEEEAESAQVQTMRTVAADSGTTRLAADRLDGTGGEPLNSEVRRFMEPRFGADFGRIRVHADRDAAQLSGSLCARAFTHRSHIYFADGEYQPDTREGRHVLAHELTHVLQQGAAPACMSTQRVLDANPDARVQRLSARGRLISHNVYPWGQPGPVGANYEANTDAGSTVTVWSAYLVFQDQYRYWCHGHSLDSYRDFDYSVYSGSPMATVVGDEWVSVAPDQTRAGDIAVWTNRWNHSAKFINPVITGGRLDTAASELTTKNGQSALTTMTLDGIAGVYGGAGIGVYRHK